MNSLFDKRVDRKLNKGVERLLKASGKSGLIPIVEVGEPVLRQHAEKYEGQLSQKVFTKLLERLRTTMLAAPGVGLAAPQIGIPLAFAVVEDHVRDDDSSDSNDDELDSNNKSGAGAGEDADDEDPREIADFPFHAIVNPYYEPRGTQTRSFYEGCLSLPGFQAVRKRWLDIDASWQDEFGKRHEEHLHGWPARIFQHETDHLSGEIYIDKAEIRSLSSDDNLGEYWWDPEPTEAARVLGFSL